MTSAAGAACHIQLRLRGQLLNHGVVWCNHEHAPSPACNPHEHAPSVPSAKCPQAVSRQPSAQARPSRQCCICVKHALLLSQAVKSSAKKNPLMVLLPITSIVVLLGKLLRPIRLCVAAGGGVLRQVEPYAEAGGT